MLTHIGAQEPPIENKGNVIKERKKERKRKKKKRLIESRTSPSLEM